MKTSCTDIKTKVKSKAQTRSKAMIAFDLNIASPAPLTKTQKAELTAIASQPEASINHSDISPLADAFWQSALRNPFYKTTEQDADYDRWFHAKVQASLDGLKDGTNRVLTDAEWQARRGELLAKLKAMHVAKRVG